MAAGVLQDMVIRSLWAVVAVMSGMAGAAGAQTSPAPVSAGVHRDAGANFPALPGQGAPTWVNSYYSPPAVTPFTLAGGRQLALAGVITDSADSGGGAKVGLYGSGDTGRGGAAVWGANTVGGWNAGTPDVAVQSIEADFYNMNSNRFSALKTGISIAAGGAFFGGFGLYVAAVNPAINGWKEGIYEFQAWNPDGDGVLLTRPTDKRPHSWFLRATNAASTANLWAVDDRGNETLAGSVDAAGGLRASSLTLSGPSRDTAYGFETPASGATVVMADGASQTIIAPAGPLASLTVRLPTCSVASDGRSARFASSQPVAALKVTATAGGVVNAPDRLAAGVGPLYLCRGSTASWYRMQ